MALSAESATANHGSVLSLKAFGLARVAECALFQHCYIGSYIGL